MANNKKVVAGMLVWAHGLEKSLLVVPDSFINSPNNTNPYTCSVSFAEQEIEWERMHII